MDSTASYDEVEIGSNRGFGLVFAGVFTVIGLLPLAGNGDVRRWSLVVAWVFLVAGAVMPRVLQPLNRIWFRFGLVLGSVVSQIVMAAVFFLLLTPTGLFLRASRRSNRNYTGGPDPAAATYWLHRESGSMGSLRNQY